MRTLLILLLLWAGGISDTPETGRERAHLIAVGDKADPFSRHDINGKLVDLREHLGKKVVVLNFFTTWCGRCNWESEGLNRVSSDYEGRAFFVRINLMDEKKKVAEFVKKYNIPFPVIPDEQGSISKLYGVKYVPANIIVGKDGVVRFTGGLLTGEDLRQRLQETMRARNE